MQYKKAYISLILASGLLLMTSAACTNKPEEPQAGKKVVANQEFSAEAKTAQRYEKLSGLAVYSSSSDITSKLAASGQKVENLELRPLFLLLNSKSPDQSILIQVPPEFQGQSIDEKKSVKIEVTGDVKSIDCAALDAFVSENFGASLIKNADGKIAYIDAESIISSDKSDSESEKSAKKVKISLEGTPLGTPVKSDRVPENQQSEEKTADVKEAINEVQAPPVSQNDNTVQAKSENDIPESLPTPVEKANSAADAPTPVNVN